jgi:hypothetical protein
VIPLPGSRGYRDVPPHPDLFEDFADVYPELLTLASLWGTGPTEPTYPDDDDDPPVVKPPETKDWGNGSFDEALTLGMGFAAIETTTASYAAPEPDAVTFGMSMSIVERQTMISLSTPRDAVALGLSFAVAEAGTAAYSASLTLVDMGMSVEVNESTTAACASASEALAFGLAITITAT